MGQRITLLLLFYYTCEWRVLETEMKMDGYWIGEQSLRLAVNLYKVNLNLIQWIILIL